MSASLGHSFMASAHGAGFMLLPVMLFGSSEKGATAPLQEAEWGYIL